MKKRRSTDRRSSQKLTLLMLKVGDHVMNAEGDLYVVKRLERYMARGDDFADVSMECVMNVNSYSAWNCRISTELPSMNGELWIWHSGTGCLI